MIFSCQLQDVIGQTVRAQMTHQASSNKIQEWAAENITSADRERFVSMAQRELIGVRENNFARYRIRPSEYYAWRPSWEKDR